ncbi:MAG: SCP-2 sterol transfer family protein [Gammaproteobacteria bacterium]|jgi:putative sterol carrier protein|nr:SCP-2 sterol transfer family protein [Gammaproteobacteria bacterium]
MSNLFKADWMNKYKEEWNKEPELSAALNKISFNSVIGYGFEGADAPVGYIKVENGHVVEAGEYSNQTLNWDLRASDSQWKSWFSKEPGMTGLGIAFTTGKLKFIKGDYTSMLKDPRMASPFVKSFGVMSRV